MTLYDYNHTFATNQERPGGIEEHDALKEPYISHLAYQSKTVFGLMPPPGQMCSWSNILYGDDYTVLYTQNRDGDPGTLHGYVQF